MSAQEVALVFTSRDLSQAGFSSVVKGLLGINNAFKAQEALVRNNIKLAGDMALNNTKLVTANRDLALSGDRVATALRAQTIATSSLNSVRANANATAEQIARAELAAARASDALTASRNRSRLAAIGQTEATDKLNASIAANNLVQSGGNRGPSFLARATPGLVIGGTALGAIGAYEAIRKGLQFQGAEAQIAVQTNRSYADVQRIGNTALNFAGTSQSLYSPTTLLQGTLQALSDKIPVKTIQSILPPLAKTSGIIHAPDTALEAQGLQSLLGYTTPDLSKATGAQAASVLSMLLRAEQLTPAPPATLTAALPRLLTSASGTGLDLSQILGAESALVGSTGAGPSVTSAWLGQLIRSSILKPTAGAQKLASQLHLDIGTKGLAEAGGNPFVYWANLYAGVGGNLAAENTLLDSSGVPGGGKLSNADVAKFGKLTPAELSAQLITGGGGGSGINALRAFLAINRGGTLGNAAQLTDQFASAGAGGTAIDTAYKQLQVGQQQKLAELGERLNADFTKLGLKINEHVIPEVVSLGTAAAAAAENVFKLGGSWWDNLTAALPGFGKGSNGTYLDTLLPNRKGLADLLTNGIQKVPVYVDPDGRVKSGGGPTAGLLQLPSAGGVNPRSILPNYFGTPPPPFHLASGPEAFSANRLGNLAGGLQSIAGLGGYILSQAYNYAMGQTSVTNIGEVRGSATGGPTAFTSNLYSGPGAARDRQRVLANLEASGPTLLKYQDELAKLNKLLLDPGNAKGVANLRNELQKLLKDPALTTTGLFTSAQLTAAGGDISHRSNSYLNAAALAAATTVVNNAQFQYKYSGEFGTQAQQEAAALKLKNAQLQQAKLTGLKPGSADYQDLVLGIKDQYKNNLGAALTQPLTDAQAKLTLAQGTGVGLGVAISGMKTLLKEQLNLGPTHGGLSQDQYNLALWQLTQAQAKTGAAPLPGPQLIRPGVAGLGALNASFTSSISRLSSGRDGVSDRIAMLEKELAQRDREIEYLKDMIGEQRKSSGSLASIDRKIQPPTKSGKSSNSLNLGNMRAPTT